MLALRYGRSMQGCGLLGSLKRVRWTSFDSKTAFITPEERDEICDSLNVDRNRVFLSIKELRQWRTKYGFDTKIGFVPTMGALHQGHLSLVDHSKKNNDFTVCSIFVNPAQFAPHEDFGKYPRQPKRDLEMMFGNGADYVFVPNQQDMYPGSKFGQTSTQVTKTHVVPDDIDSVSEGAARPGFFRGVSTVVSKLLNIVQPTNIYMGQKDGLQVIVIRRLVRDLNFPTRVVPCDTIREPDGLALSSRNVYLSKEQREAAPTLYASLKAIKHAFDGGDRSYSSLKQVGQKVLDSQPLFRTEYLSLCDAVDGSELNDSKPLSDGNIMASAAVSFGNCRILDNILLGKQW